MKSQTEILPKVTSRMPSDCISLLEKFPKSCWVNHLNLGPITNFWLRKHDKFRHLNYEICDSLRKTLSDHPNERMLLGPTRAQITDLINELALHHHVEDNHYFPKYLAALPELNMGFSLLENDHEELHKNLGLVTTTAHKLFSTLKSPPSIYNHNLAALFESMQVLQVHLNQHLHDEEELIVPLVLQYGEERFGV